MELEEIESSVIVVTQFDRFGDHPKPLQFEDLFSELRGMFKNLFIGGVYYSNVDSKWRGQLKQILIRNGFIK